MIFTTKHIHNDSQLRIGDRSIERQNIGKFLGVTLDDKLSFKHVNHISKKLSKVVGILNKIKHFFPPDILRYLYLTLFYPYLTYCVLAWGKSQKTVLNPINILQKKAVRIITNSDYRAHTHPLFKSLTILKLDDIYTYNSLIHIFKVLNLNKYPAQLNELETSQPSHRYNLRHTQYMPPRSRIKKCDQDPLIQGIKNWNILPQELTTLPTLHKFKYHCKSSLLSRY